MEGDGSDFEDFEKMTAEGEDEAPTSEPGSAVKATRPGRGVAADKVGGARQTKTKQATAGRAKASASAKGAKGGCKKGKGMKSCRGCGNFKKLEEFPLGHNLCWPDKRASDNLYGFSRRQNEMDWFDGVAHEETKLQHFQ